MATIDMHDAKTQLSDLVARAEAGEEIVIARRSKPAVKLVPVEVAEKAGVREARRGAAGSMSYLRDAMTITDWFAPLPEEELMAWEGKSSDDPGKEMPRASCSIPMRLPGSSLATTACLLRCPSS